MPGHGVKVHAHPIAAVVTRIVIESIPQWRIVDAPDGAHQWAAFVQYAVHQPELLPI